MGVDVTPINSHLLTVDILNQTKDCHYIFGNFLNLDNNVYQHIVQGKTKFSIYEHDHKYLVKRDPSGYENYLAPKNELANLYCKVKNVPYELVGSLPYSEFLEKLGQNETFLFFPETMETLCRVVVEARMMNMKAITNGVLG